MPTPVWNCLSDLLSTALTGDSWIPWLRLTIILAVLAVVLVVWRFPRTA
jgi:hypothetical protein